MGDIVAPDNPGDASDSGRKYKILPRPWVVLGCQYRGRLRVVRDAGEELLGRAGITGLQDEFRIFRPEPDTRTIIVNLKPHAAFRMLGCPMHEMANAHIRLDALLKGSTVRELEGRIADAPTIADAARIVGDFISRLSERSAAAIHPVVIGVVETVLAERGAVRIETLAARGGLTRRQLERLFRLQVGMSPKRFASLVRFDWAVRRLSSHPRAIDLAYHAGFADQAHFIRTFSRHAGVTPGRFGRGGENA